MRCIFFPISLLVLAGCNTMETTAGSETATAKLARADGTDKGIAKLAQRSDGLWLNVSAKGLPAGTYGIHLHAVGKCEGPDFTSAGAHWNPEGKQHGFDNPMGAHAGDLRNLVVNASGVGMLEAKLSDATLSSALDADGLSMLIHEKADDYSTDPSGNSGKRIICGVFVKG
jgi:superoxide dismutase, Cu-Zn family